MVKLDEIREAITEIEEQGVSFQNCERLAALYTIIDHKLNEINPVIQEYSEILPSYQLYCKVKRKYEMKDIDEETVRVAVKTLCEEIKDFLVILYSNTNTEMERAEIKKMLNSLNFFDNKINM